MKTIHDILKLGDPRLYEVCAPVLREELDEVPGWIQQLHEAMEDVRRVYGFGRGIAVRFAPTLKYQVLTCPIFLEKEIS